MKPEEAYSIRLVSDVLIARKNLFHVETWIEEYKYKSSIFLNLKRITFQGNETMPKIY